MPEVSPGNSANIVIASQIVRDVKVGGGRYRRELARDTARLRTGLRDKNYIPADKVNCEFRPLEMTGDKTVVVEIHGGMLQGSDFKGLDPHFHHPFHLDLRTPLTLEQIRSMSLEDLLVQHCNDVTVDDGGNAQNMVINMCLVAISGLRQRIHVTVLSSSDPLKRLPDEVRAKVQPYLQYYELPELDDRIAIHLPWEYEDGKKGTFGLTTEPEDISPKVDKLLRTRRDVVQLLRASNCFVACDSSFQQLRTYGQPGRYTTIVNAATKWRSTIAGLAYGTDTVLPMNHKEAADVVHVIKHVGTEEELHKVQRIPFPSPLKTNGNEIDEDALHQLDHLLAQFARYNHPHDRLDGLVAFNYPITFEEHGGLVAGTRNRRSIVAFTSTPDEQAEKGLLAEFGNPDEMNTGDIETMGAGDAAASMIAIFNTIDPQEFIQPFLEGREDRNTLLHQFAQTIFVSAMSRIVGAFLIHTHRTYIANIDLQKLQSLFRTVAKEALSVARQVVKNANEHHINDLNTLGMKVVTWNLGSAHVLEAEGLSE